jgi:hypothetical protein
MRGEVENLASFVFVYRIVDCALLHSFCGASRQFFAFFCANVVTRGA